MIGVRPEAGTCSNLRLSEIELNLPVAVQHIQSSWKPEIPGICRRHLHRVDPVQFRFGLEHISMAVHSGPDFRGRRQTAQGC